MRPKVGRGKIKEDKRDFALRLMVLVLTPFLSKSHLDMEFPDLSLELRICPCVLASEIGHQAVWDTDIVDELMESIAGLGF